MKLLTVLAKSDDCLTVSLIAIDSTKDNEAVRELLTDKGASYSFLSIWDYYKKNKIKIYFFRSRSQFGQLNFLIDSADIMHS